MGTFKIRKTGADLHSLPFYNTYGDGEFNALQDEYAPKSCGGTMSAMTNKNAAGNCTWYGVGRQQEATGYRVPLEHRRGNAKDWSVDTNSPTVGALVVFIDGGYGHVAFVEKIENGEVYVSESAYSERGNDFLFKYGRTVSEICRVWDMTVKGYMLPDGVFTSYDDVEGELKAENGIFTATSKHGSNIRKAPSLSAERVGGLPKGEEIAYTGYIDVEGIRWVKTSKGYIARRKLDSSEVYGDARFASETAKPTPPNKGRAGQVLTVRDSYPHATFTAYADKACTQPYNPWTIAKYGHNLQFMIVEDHDPVFLCKQYGQTPMGGTDRVWIKYEPGIGFDA